jgi:hypothetical protein
VLVCLLSFRLRRQFLVLFSLRSGAVFYHRTPSAQLKICTLILMASHDFSSAARKLMQRIFSVFIFASLIKLRNPDAIRFKISNPLDSSLTHIDIAHL